MKCRFSSTLLAALSPILLWSLPLVAKAQVVTNLHIFGSSPSDGNSPKAGLVQGNDGNLYGTALQGGTHSVGTVFRISPSGTYTNLHHFADGPNDEASPAAGLVQGTDGNFYGTTQFGGAAHGGVVFRISPSGSYSNLHSFQGGVATNGDLPFAALVQGRDGNFYGTTAIGGANDLGTVFRLSPSGVYTNLHSFAGYPNDGSQPRAGLVQGGDGNFYGMTYYDGTNICQCGTVFQISPSGDYTILHSFGNHPDGAFPYTGDVLVEGSDGNFYGTISQGGAGNGGAVFRISPDGSYSNLYSFTGLPNEGRNPEAGLVQGSDGNFYGTTAGGGTNNVGTVFKLAVSLPSPANQMNAISVAGANVVITFASVAGETYQLQYASDLTSGGNWLDVPGISVTNSIGGPQTMTNFGGALSQIRYYRLAITP